MSYSLKVVFITVFCFFGLVASECPPPLPYLLDSIACILNPTAFPTVSTSVGTIGGRAAFNQIANTRVSMYLGIRFGKPPIGNQRFMKPIPADPFTSTYWGFDYGSTCVPTIPIGIVPPPSEDCLFLNVYVPEGCTLTSPCAVMVWIYGGGFIFGSGNNDFYGPEYFLENKVIFVSFNYRLGPFGFLSSEDGNIPGNAGLLDQNLALKWVNQNIEAFGGNKNSITIFGESAGAASVCYHCMSDQSAGLFQNVILESGSCLSDWAYSKHPLQTLKTLAKNLGITTNDIAAIKTQLQNVPADVLANAALLVNGQSWTIQSPFLYPPSIDYNSPNPFITDSPRNIVKKRLENNQPICHGAEVIAGINTNEGGFARIFFSLNPNLLSDISTNKEMLTPYKCNLDPGSSDSIAVSDKIYNKYFSNQLDQWAFYKYITHMVMLDGIAELIKAFLDSGKFPFLYNFNYCGPANSLRNAMFPEVGCDKIRAIHTDEIFTTFTQKGITLSALMSLLGAVTPPVSQKTPAELKLSKQMSRAYTNFAKNKSPNSGKLPDPEIGTFWLPSTSKSNMTWMKFDNPLSILSQYLANDIEFWANVCNPN